MIPALIMLLGSTLADAAADDAMEKRLAWERFESRSILFCQDLVEERFTLIGDMTFDPEKVRYVGTKGGALILGSATLHNFEAVFQTKAIDYICVYRDSAGTRTLMEIKTRDAE